MIYPFGHCLQAFVSVRDLLYVEDGDESDEEVGQSPSLIMMPGHRSVNPIEHCRDKSRSAWLHFPHVELVFLFFAFEGAVASQVEAIQEATCPAVFFTALFSLVSSSKNAEILLRRQIARRDASD